MEPLPVRVHMREQSKLARPLAHVFGLGADSPTKEKKEDRVTAQAAATTSGAATAATDPTPTAAAAQPRHWLDARSEAWLSQYGLMPAPSGSAAARAQWLRGDVADTAQTAEDEAWRACDLALSASATRDDDAPFDESMLERAAVANASRRHAAAQARASLSARGVSEEHLRMPLDSLLPLLYEMVHARTVGGSSAARRCMPAPSSCNDRRGSNPAAASALTPPSSLAAVSLSPRLGSPSASPAASLDPRCVAPHVCVRA